MVLKYQTKLVLPGHQADITALAFSPDGKRFSSAGSDGLVFVWSLSSGDLLLQFTSPNPVHSLIWPWSDPDILLLGCDGGVLNSVTLYPDIMKACSFPAHELNSSIRHLSACQGNRQFIASGANHEVKIWKRNVDHGTESWQMLTPLPKPDVSEAAGLPLVTGLQWLVEPSSDKEGKLVVSYLSHGIACWDLASLLMVWRVQHDACGSLALSPDRSVFAVYHPSRSYDLFKVASRQKEKLRQLLADGDAAGHYLPACFIHDGTFLVGGGVAGKVRIWGVETGTRHQVLRHPGNCIVKAISGFYDFDTDTFLIITGTSQGTESRIYVWDTVEMDAEMDAPVQSSAQRDSVHIELGTTGIMLGGWFFGFGIGMFVLGLAVIVAMTF
ncbi:WD40 repeat-like protein [Auriscalpium vulgare]|uniref:WD40 repeat-like protein n=1 Tax=Auriscalpium vulgare TaxID=40419 RepID=A0ACB8R0T0_9AGAM|nr:WD40 repeat-like protein [Auriscalpium vulgare]